MEETNRLNRVPLGQIPSGYVYRDQTKRYPWWVKSVERITTPIDEAAWSRKVTDLTQKRLLGEPEIAKANAKLAVEKITDRIRKELPGHQLKDLALHYAATSFFAAGVSKFEGNFIMHFRPMMQAALQVIHPPQELGVDRWQGSPEEASQMIETALLNLGASQVGFTYLEPRFLEHNVSIDPKVENISNMEDGRVLVPENLKYVVLVTGQAPHEASKFAPGQIGDFADRAAYEERQMIWVRTMNFIRGLGYQAVPLPGRFPPVIPFALMAGLGEMGRMNRMVSPYYGGALRIEGILTDLPLALDKPIDFGLQEYCRHCRKCAKICPANALSDEKEPTWTPKSRFSLAGKKLWFEDVEKCNDWTLRSGNYCAACLFACTWTKDDQTFLHALARFSAARLPFLGKALAWFDDLFGYGTVAKRQQGEWWNRMRSRRAVRSRRR
jgi:epoxyqueuosine reductase